MAFMTGGGEAPSVGLPIRIVVIGLRVLCWPLTGLLTDAPAVSIVTAVSVLTLSVWPGEPPPDCACLDRNILMCAPYAARCTLTRLLRILLWPFKTVFENRQHGSR